MQLTSPAFKHQHAFPIKHAKEGENLSPPLAWEEVPEETEELVLLFENTTPSTQEPFVLWLVYHISPDLGGLPEGFRHKQAPVRPVAVRQGKNSLGNIGYNGPIGIAGRRFHLRFQLLALDRAFRFPPGMDKKSLMRAVIDNILDEAELMATYTRPAD